MRHDNGRRLGFDNIAGEAAGARRHRAARGEIDTRTKADFRGWLKEVNDALYVSHRELVDDFGAEGRQRLREWWLAGLGPISAAERLHSSGRPHPAAQEAGRFDGGGPAELRQILEQGVVLVGGESESYIELGKEKVHVAVMFDVTGYGPHQGAIYALQNRFHGSKDAALQAAGEILEEWILEHYPDSSTETFDGRTWVMSPEDLLEAIRGTKAAEFIEFLDADGNEMREGGHRAADFNTLEDLVEHAASDLGATHVVHADAHTKIYFPRGGTHSYEEASVWRKGGYWHAQGPGARTGVRGLPRGAEPIGGRAQPGRAAEAGNEDLVGFTSWPDALAYARTGGPLYYQAPMDLHPTRLMPGRNQTYRYEARARTIRLWPPGSVGRGRARTSDPFNADVGHLSRFSRPA